MRCLLDVIRNFVCIYCGNFSGTYEEVQMHQAASHGYGK